MALFTVLSVFFLHVRSALIVTTKYLPLSVAMNLVVCLDDMSSVGTNPKDYEFLGLELVSFARFPFTSLGLKDLPVRGLSWLVRTIL